MPTMKLFVVLVVVVLLCFTSANMDYARLNQSPYATYKKRSNDANRAEDTRGFNFEDFLMMKKRGDATCEDTYTWCSQIVAALTCEGDFHYQGSSSQKVKEICPETCSNCP